MRARFAGAHTIVDFTRMWTRLHRCARFATLLRRLHTWLQKRFRRRERPLCSLSSSLRGSPWLSAAHHRRVAVWNRFLSSCSFCGVLETKEFVTNLPPPRSFFRALSLVSSRSDSRVVIPQALGSTCNLRIFVKNTCHAMSYNMKSKKRNNLKGYLSSQQFLFFTCK